MIERASKKFSVPLCVDGFGNTRSISAPDFPVVFWPNGRGCLEVNLYLLQYAENGASTLMAGGSVKTYAYQLIHLVRFCFNRNIDFIDLTDGEFSRFIYALTDEENPRALGKRRTAKTVRSIGRRCLNFLLFVGSLYRIKDFVSENGQILAQPLTRPARRNHYGGQVWTHRSFPPSSPDRVGAPVSDEAIVSLHQAAQESSPSPYVYMRRAIMLYLLEQTGCRRAELSLIKIGPILKALAEQSGYLSIPTIKRGGNVIDERMVPVSKSLLQLLKSYIEYTRSSLVRRTCGLNNDDGFLFLNSKSGRRMSMKYISTELSRLSKYIDIDHSIGAHSFRHKFITKKFVELSHENAMHAREGSLASNLGEEGLLLILLELTGHSALESVRRYIHLVRSD